MLIVITHDVETKTAEGRKRLRRVSRVCLDFGQRVQFSVFECSVSKENWVRLRERLLTAYDAKHDSLRFYFLGEDAKGRIEHHGTKEVIDLSGLLLG